MKVAVYTLTRDRLEYTQHCFSSLEKLAGYPYTHYVIDNGSVDGTRDWLLTQNVKVIASYAQNMGISYASNLAVKTIIKDGFDLIIKMDNDCEVISENMIGQIVEIYQGIPPFAQSYVLSPRVEGIVNQPSRAWDIKLGGRKIGVTGMVGGLFHIVQASVYAKYEYPVDLPKAFGQDQHFCEWARKQGCTVGYIEGLVVNHYETTHGQCKRYPEYFKRKWAEEKDA